MTNTARRSCWIMGLWLLLAPLLAAEQRSPYGVAHRGLLLDAPENTLANFRACLELGLGFELDVRRSQDGVLVCVHDDTVDRTSNGTGKVSTLTLKQLKELDAGSWFAPEFRGEKIPTLAEVFTLLAQYPQADVLVAIDIKDADIEADIVALAKKDQVLPRLVMIGRAISDADVRHRLRAADAKTAVARLAASPAEWDAVLSDADCQWVYVRFVPETAAIAKAHAAGKRVFLSGPMVAGLERDNWRRGAVRGVDAVLTDYALELKRQLRADQRRAAELWQLLQPHFTPPEEYRNDFGKYRSPLRFADGTPVKTPADWQRRRDEIRAAWMKMLGPWPELLDKPRIRYLSSERRENFTQHRVQVEIYPGDKYTEGHLLIPDGKGPFPAVLVPFYESATSVGLGKRGQGTHDYGLQLARRGFVTLSIGTPGSVETPDQQTRELLTDAGEGQERQPLAFLAYVAANCHTALAQLPQVDGERIGIVGLSYGGKWSMFASCLHDKFACAVWSDPGIVFDESNGNVNYWEPWYLGYEKGVRRPPGIPNEQRPRTGLYKRLIEEGRDLNELHPLMCPRPLLVAGGTEDPPRNWRALNHVAQVNELLGYTNRVAMTHRQTHVPTPEALERTLAFLEYFLKYQ
ncbi:MAG: glycerophosphodiester phosphodiesterase family protein [Gemmataceae bacterium]